MMVCMMVDYVNFIVERLSKNKPIVTRAWSNSEAQERFGKRGKCNFVSTAKRSLCDVV